MYRIQKLQKKTEHTLSEAVLLCLKHLLNFQKDIITL